MGAGRDRRARLAVRPRLAGPDAARREDAGPEEPADTAGDARPGPWGRATGTASGAAGGAALSAGQAVYSRGVLPALVHAADPAQELPEPAPVRSPATLDRSATLRWLAGGLACLALFWGVSQFADRLGRLYLVWGAIIAGVLPQHGVRAGAGGLPGGRALRPLPAGTSPFWAPTVDDLLTTPNALVLRTLAAPAAAPGTRRGRRLSPTGPSCSGP